MNELGCDRLAVLEGEIKHLKRTAVLDILEIGDRLLEAKDLVPYGEWEQWLSENVQISNRTARNFMRAARIYQGEERQALADLEITKLYYLSELPEEKRNELIGTADVRNMTTRELKAAVKKQDEDLTRFQLFDPDEVRRLHEQIMASDDIELVKEWKKANLELAQDIAELTIDLEVKIGELLAKEKATEGRAAKT